MVSGPSVTSRSYMVFLHGKINSVRYIAQVVNPVLLPLFRQESNVPFQQDKARLHTAAATQRALRGVQQLHWPTTSPDLTPVEHMWDMMKRDLTLSPEPATIIVNYDNGCKIFGIIYRRMAFGTFLTICM